MSYIRPSVCQSDPASRSRIPLIVRLSVYLSVCMTRCKEARFLCFTRVMNSFFSKPVSYIFFWSFMVWNTHKRKNECKIFFHSSDMPRNSPHRLKLVKKPIKPCYWRRFLSKLHGASYFFTLVLVLNVYFSRIWWYSPLGVLKRARKLPKMLKFCILGLFWPLWGYCSASGHTLKGFFCQNPK